MASDAKTETILKYRDGRLEKEEVCKRVAINFLLTWQIGTQDHYLMYCVLKGKAQGANWWVYMSENENQRN